MSTVPGYEKRVPDYWLRFDPDLLRVDIPHPLAGLFPAYLVDGGNTSATTPTDAQKGTPGVFFPMLSNFADFAALSSSGVVPSDADWDTKGQYIVLGDGSEAHYRLGAWSAGRVP